VVNRIKIAANMKIDEHFAAQDGAIRYEAPGGKTIDMRVSIVPTVDGEKIVLRILSEYIRTLTLNDLGFSEEYKAILEKVAHKPFGMILTTGPTGAGKSTTLYALLKLRNFPDVNISTIEDPVEYKIPGINHIQVNTDTNLTFATGLRALVRQDPNIILVGEIRDGETASIAVNAALTGHLLFSTLHANDAATAVPRLLEMGVEPFLLASTLEVIIGQRLIRKICPQCRYSYSLPPYCGSTRRLLGRASVHRQEGASNCNDTVGRSYE
jgi:type II secretory ATPase GspE/PulE/Tfp pilus assembly ATPase PilB-like protein